MYYNKSTIHHTTSPVHSEKSPIHSEKSPIHSEESLIHFEKSPIHFEKSPIHSVGTDKSNDFDHLPNRLRSGPKLPSPMPLWQSGLSRSTYPFPQDLKRSPVRTLLTTSLNRGKWTESPHGGTPARESHARPDGCGGHHLRFCGNGLDHFAK